MQEGSVINTDWKIDTSSYLTEQTTLMQAYNPLYDETEDIEEEDDEESFEEDYDETDDTEEESDNSVAYSYIINGETQEITMNDLSDYKDHEVSSFEMSPFGALLSDLTTYVIGGIFFKGCVMNGKTYYSVDGEHFYDNPMYVVIDGVSGLRDKLEENE